MLEKIFSQLTVIELISLGMFILLILILLITDLINYILIRRKINSVNSEKQPVSVVITAQNDAEFLKINLKYFLEQNYPVFEVIVVDDCSEDDTQTVLAQYKQLYPNLKTTAIKADSKFLSTKKLAVNIGMKAANYDIVLFSEGNCSPVSSDWIDIMQSAFKSDTNVVLGYSKLKKANTFRGDLIFFDRFIKNIRTLGFALRKNAFRGDGTNVAYRKKAYFAYNCFAGNANIEAGYDAIPVKELSDGKNIEVVLHSDAHMYVDYVDVKKEWKHYKMLYFQCRRFYRSGLKLRLDAIPFVKFLLLLNFILLAVFFSNKILVAVVMGVYLIIRAVNVKLFSKALNERFLFINSLYMELIVGVLSFVQYLKARIG